MLARTGALRPTHATIFPLFVPLLVHTIVNLDSVYVRVDNPGALQAILVFPSPAVALLITIVVSALHSEVELLGVL